MTEDTEARLQRAYGVRVEDLRGEHPLTASVVQNVSVEGPSLSTVTLVATYDDGSVHAVNFVRDEDRKIAVEISPDRTETEGDEGLFGSRFALGAGGDGFHVRIKGVTEAKCR